MSKKTSETVTLNALIDGAKQSGTATFTSEGNKTKVSINITPGPKGVEQPAHVHVGVCLTVIYEVEDFDDYLEYNRL